MITFLLILFNIFIIFQSSQVISVLNKEDKLNDSLYALKLWNILYLCLSIIGIMINFGLLYFWYGTATGKSISKADNAAASTIDNYSKQIPQFFSGMQNFNQNNPYYQ